ncbi:hypothetical protein GM708_04335 [Vibrio cholerae]|nr:hypothetical protein [Vibrio cholerae]
MKKLTAAKVFIPGGLPNETYVSREHLGIEKQVAAWEESAHTALLSVSGPTKTGKTVILKRSFREGIWLSGGALETADEFWASICDELEVFTDYGLASTKSEQHQVGAEGNLNGVIASGGGSVSDQRMSERGLTRNRSRSTKSAARKALSDEKPVLIIDDFHYLPQAEQAKIVHGLKDLIFEGLPVILVTVPHRAYDAVRVEKEMTGRVDSIPLGAWDADDLVQIALLGFAALGLDIPDHVTRRLAEESFGSPHLMQTHCLDIARTVAEGETTVTAPSWDAFFRARAAAASKSAFDLLKQGPRQRNDRNARKLKDGQETDIYGAVLAAIASTGPRTSLPYEDLRAALRNVLDSDLPQRHEVTNILDQMTKIARDKIEGEPVLEYDSEYSTLYIADPFFAYYLRWAPESLKDIGIHPK